MVKVDKMIVEAGTKTYYKVCFADGFGGGHFSDIRSETIEEARVNLVNINKQKKGCKNYDYWEAIRNNARIFQIVETSKKVI